MLSQSELRENLDYDPETGAFTWISRPANRVKIGDTCTAKDSYGYVQIQLRGRNYRAHALAILYMTGEFPSDKVDHINGIPSDNRFANLREANHSENLCNQPKRGGKSSKYKGVYWDRSRGKWAAKIKKDSKQYFLGRFDSEERAFEAYKSAADRLHGEFANY